MTFTAHRRNRAVYDHRGEIVTLADVAWGDTYADDRTAARKRAAEDSARARGEYVPSMWARAGAWTIGMTLLSHNVYGDVVPIREEPVEGHPGALMVVYRVDGRYSAPMGAAAIEAEPVDNAEAVVRDGVLWVRSVVIDPWAGSATAAMTEDPPF